MNRWNRPRPSNPTAAHLRGVLQRLGVAISVDERESTSELLHGLDRALEQQAEELRSVKSSLAVTQAAVERAPTALVVVGADGQIQSMSASAASLLAGGASAVLPRPVLDSVVSRVKSTREPWSDVIEVFGPPSRTLTLIANPLTGNGGQDSQSRAGSRYWTRIDLLKITGLNPPAGPAATVQ